MFRYILLIFTLILTLNAEDIQVLNSSFYLDKNHAQSVDDIYAKRASFTKFNEKNKNLGFKLTPVWIYVKLKNITKEKSYGVIRFSYPLHDFIYVYKYRNSKIYENYLTGDLTDFDTRKIKTSRFVVPYSMAPNETKEILMKIDSQSSLNLGMQFLSRDKYLSVLNNANLLYGFYYGAVVIMLLYNLILFFIIKARVYLDYVLFHTTNLFLQLGLNGLAFEYLYPNHPSLNLVYIPTIFAVSNYFIIKFALSFLELDNLRGKSYLYFKTLSILSLVAVLLTFVMDYSQIIKFIVLLSMVTVNSLFITGIYLFKKYKDNSAKFFVIAWSFMLIGIFLEEAHNLGFINSSFIASYGAQIGAFIELTLLSIALAYRYNTLFNALVKTKSDLHALNIELEDKVEKRTKKLDIQNRQLNLEVDNKNILLRELYHRVKNNLQIISSLLSIQSKRIKDKKAKSIFDESIQRIKSIAMLHEKLYKSDNLQIISMQQYTHDLVSELKQGFKGNDIDFKIICDDINLNLEIAVPIGLIINELITNSLKYAFINKKDDKQIKIQMKKNKNETFTLIISDNGQGANMQTLKEGFGFKLLEFLASYQLKGKIRTDGNDGLIHKIIFSKDLLA
jgi:two-component sensor histidine kinase